MTKMSEAFEQVMTLEQITNARLADHGYGDTTIEPVAGEFAAKAVKITASGQQFRAQALGVTRQDAAEQLVSVVTRK